MKLREELKFICPSCGHKRFIVIEIDPHINTFEITDDSDSAYSKRKESTL